MEANADGKKAEAKLKKMVTDWESDLAVNIAVNLDDSGIGVQLRDLSNQIERAVTRIEADKIQLDVERATDEDALYFELAVSRAGVEGLPVLPKDVLLIQDCSESMTRTKLDFFKEGILDYLRTLTTADRINLMRYSDTPDLCFEGWQPVTAESLDQSVRFTQAMRARGQTDLFTPLQQVLKLPRKSCT